MKKIDWKLLLITSIVCILPIFLGIAFYDRIPEKVAIHFNFQGNADGWAVKSFFVFGFPPLLLAFHIFCCITTDLSKKQPDTNRKAMRAIKWMIPLLCWVMYIITLCIALGYDVDIRRVVMIVIGLIFIVLGNYTPKMRNTNMCRFPKFSPETERKLTRVIGYVSVIGGFLCILSIAFSQIVSIIVLGALVLTMCIIPFCVKRG